MTANRIWQKLIVISLLIAYCILTSCDSESLMVKFDSCVANAEQHQEDYNLGQWEKMDNRFSSLVEEYKAIKDEMTDDQKSHVDLLIGKYLALRTKGQTNRFLEELSGGLKQIEGFLEEIAHD